MANDMTTTTGRGFRGMSAKKAREIRSLGGRNSPQNFKNNRELASRAGKKGGEARSGT